MQLPYPVKLIWSREKKSVRAPIAPQSSSHLKAALGQGGTITAWKNDYVQSETAEGELRSSYTIPAVSRRQIAYQSNQKDGPWRSVNSTQHGFYNECFMDELAEKAGIDPL